MHPDTSTARVIPRKATPPVSVALHPILSGEIRLAVMRPRRPRRGPAKLARTLAGGVTRRGRWYPVPAYLVMHPHHGPVMIDTGYAHDVDRDPARTLGTLFGRVLMRHRLTGPPVTDRLARLGVGAREVRTVVMTHLHLDHASGAEEFPEATFVVDARERAAATGQRGPGPYACVHLDRIGAWRTLDPDAGTPFDAFSRTHDLLGDGSIRLVATPGHSPGHLAVLLRLSGRWALLCGDAAMSTRELAEPLVDGLIVDQDRYLAAGDELRAFIARHPDTLAIPSHDADLWRRLPDRAA